MHDTNATVHSQSMFHSFAVRGLRTSTMSVAHGPRVCETARSTVRGRPQSARPCGPRMYISARSAVRGFPQSPRSPKQKRTQSTYPWCSSIPLNCDHRAKQHSCQTMCESLTCDAEAGTHLSPPIIKSQRPSETVSDRYRDRWFYGTDRQRP